MIILNSIKFISFFNKFNLSSVSSDSSHKSSVQFSSVAVMAAEVVVVVPVSEAKEENTVKINKDPSLSTYLGLSFAIFLGFLPKSSISLVSSLQSRNRALSFKLIQAEEQLKQMKYRRKEDSKANARVVEIFASHRNGWQQEERKLLQRIEGSAEEIAHLREKIDELEKTEADLRVCLDKSQREVEEREEMINFMSRQGDEEDEEEEGEDVGDEDYGVGSIQGGETEKEEVGGGVYHDSQIRACYGTTYQEANGEFGDHCGGNFSRFGNIRVSEGMDPISEECYMYRNGEEMPVPYGQHNGGFTQSFVSPAPTVCSEKTGGWQDARYDSVESMYHMKQFAARRESPWKVHGESTGVPSKLKLLEQELLNLERNDMGDQSKVPSSMRKQAKRYQNLAGKIDDLCKRMSTDPCEQNLSAEFRTRRQTEFLLEAYRLQQRAIETRQKLTTLQTETAKSHFGGDLSAHAKLTTKRSLDSVKNNFREIQRNLEVWLARIMGDLEGVLSRDGASRVKEYYISRNPFVQ